MPKSESSKIVLNVQTGWEPILDYAREALAEASGKKARRRIEEAIRICEKSIAAAVRIPLRLNRRKRAITASTHK
jgi:hypothetical protein